MTVLLLGIHFHTDDLDCINDTVNIFIFPDLSLSAGSKASMVTQRLDTALDANTLTSYADAAALMKQQHIPPIVGWEAAAKMLKQWLVMVTVLLGPQEHHLAVFVLSTLLEAANEVNSRLRAQAGAQQDMPAALVRLIHTKFNKSFRQVFTSHLPVRWPHLTPLIRTLTTGYFCPDTATVPGGFRLNVPTALAPYRATAPLHRAPAQRGGDEHTATSQVAVQTQTLYPTSKSDWVQTKTIDGASNN